MAKRRSVVLNGDLGSGKSTVSMMLAAQLGIRRISVGDLFRTLAAQLGMTAVEINLHAELDDKIDHYVDQLQRDIAASGEQLIVDSRLAWHFFADALKVHLIAEPLVAAQRALGRPANSVESYADVEEARDRLAIRSESERMRFVTRYGVDKTRLRNYDLVCDTTSATPEQVAEKIVEHLHSPMEDGPACYLAPKRIYFTEDPDAEDGADPDGQITVGYSAPNFFAVQGHRRLSAAIRDGEGLVAVKLMAEAQETIAGVSCVDYFEANAGKFGCEQSAGLQY
ncbi:AAA family ATPase [Rhizocola hellebori]|nr:AAA family ATPase [Rhizocola hellebori]